MVLASNLGRQRIGDELHALLVDRLQGLQSCFAPNVLRSGCRRADDGDRAEECIELFAPSSQHLRADSLAPRADSQSAVFCSCRAALTLLASRRATCSASRPVPSLI